MADLPFDLDAGLNEQLAGALDVEGKIPRALEALGPVAGRDVVLVGPPGIRARQLTELGARVHAAIAPLADATVRDALAGLTPAEQARLVALMSKVKTQLTTLAASDPRADFSEIDDIENPDDVGASTRAV